MEPIKFKGYNVVPQFLKTDKSYRICIDISKDQVERVKDIILQNLPEDTVFDIVISQEQ